MTPKKVPTNDLDRALLALSKSNAALPQFLREVGKGELWFATPYHPEIIGEELEMTNGMVSPFVEFKDGKGRYVAVFSSFQRLRESLRASKVPPRIYAAASMEAVKLLEVLGKMEIRGMLNMGCKTGSITMDPNMMRDVADGSAFEPEEPSGEIISKRLNIIDPSDYPTDLLQPVFEILRQHRNFRAVWVLEHGKPEEAGADGRHFQFMVQMEPRDPAVYHEFNLVLATAALAAGHQADSGHLDETDTEYITNLWAQVEPFYIAADHQRPAGR